MLAAPVKAHTGWIAGGLLLVLLALTSQLAILAGVLAPGLARSLVAYAGLFTGIALILRGILLRLHAPRD